MPYILLSAALFSLTVILHILLHRILIRFGINTFKTVIIFFPGLLFTWFLPLGAIVLFLIYSGIYLIYFVNVYIGEASPSAQIYFLIKNSQANSEEKILGHFSDQELVVKRLNNLADSGLAVKKGTKYYPESKGRVIVFFFEVYRKILGWEEGGQG